MRIIPNKCLYSLLIAVLRKVLPELRWYGVAELPTLSRLVLSFRYVRGLDRRELYYTIPCVRGLWRRGTGDRTLAPHADMQLNVLHVHTDRILGEEKVGLEKVIAGSWARPSAKP